MADRWTLVTPSGSLELNASFSAPQYEPGGVDTSAALRRHFQTSYHRSGDGLRTPGAFRLTGMVWDDSHNIGAMVAELDGIKDAVADCSQVIRTTSAGTYTYDKVSGGPPPEVYPDGLGGFTVVIDLWPGVAEPIFVPTAPPMEVLAAAVTPLTWGDTHVISIPDAPHPPGTMLIVAVGVDGNDTLVTANGLTNLNGLGDLAKLPDQLGNNRLHVWGFRRLLNALDTSVTLTFAGNNYGTAHAVVVSGPTGASDAIAGTNIDVGVAITGTATVNGNQLFMGALNEYGIN